MQSQGDVDVLGVGLRGRVKQFAQLKWGNLNDRQKTFLKKGWGVITYKWRWQIAMNIPYLAIFILDRTIPAVHQFDMAVLNAVVSRLPIPELISSRMGLG